MSRLFKMFLLFVCLGTIFVCIAPWTTEIIGLTNARASTNVQRLKSISGLFHGEELQINNSFKTKVLRKFFQDQLYKTLPSSPVEYQGTSDYTTRQRQTDEACRRLNFTRNPDVLPQLWMQENYNLVYCGIPKVGTTFWRRVFQVLESQIRVTSPYLLDNKSPKTVQTIAREKHTTVPELLKNATKFLFIREPYGRVYSAYVNKLVTPNYHFWNVHGRVIATHFRKNATELSLKCGHDITFPEFVKYVIKKNTNNKHFTPQSKLCKPCDVRYDVIGKMESFREDVLYLLDSVGALNKDVRFYDFKKEHYLDSILNTIFHTFRNKGKFLKCISIHRLLQRMWRVFQITGLLDKSQNYPLTEGQSSTMTVSRFIALVMKTHRMSDISAKDNTREAFLQAYQGVPIEDLKLLKKVYYNDCEIFGYPSEPEELFKRNDATSNRKPDFNYFDYRS